MYLENYSYGCMAVLQWEAVCRCTHTQQSLHVQPVLADEAILSHDIVSQDVTRRVASHADCVQ